MNVRCFLAALALALSVPAVAGDSPIYESFRGVSIGRAQFDFGGALRVDGVTLHKTLDGRLTLSYPERRDARDFRHYQVRPLNDDIRREIERQVFALLGQGMSR